MFFSTRTQVQTWLSAVLGEQPVPQFEVNTRTVEILYQLAVASEVRCKDTSLLIEDFKQKASEYHADSKSQAHTNISLKGYFTDLH